MRQSNLADLLDSDSDDDFITSTSMPKATEKMATEKRPRGRAAANRVTKTETKAATRRAGAKKAAAAEQEIERQALADKPANHPTKAARGRKAKAAEETEEEAEGEEEDADVLATPPGSDEPAPAKAGRGRPRKESVVPESAQKVEKPAASRRRGRKAVEPEEPVPQQDDPSEIPETQADDHMDIDAEEQDQVEDLPKFSRFSAPPSVQRVNSYHVPLSASKRPASSSPHDSDPSARRRLSEMTKKYEALELKYKDLRNVTITEAEKTFDRLKKTSDEKTQSTHFKNN